MTSRFTLLQRLGRGGMGVVWQARDEESGALVALKLLHSQFADDPEYLERFAREVLLAQRVASPSVVAVQGYGVREGVPYLVMEYIAGPSLRERLSEGPLPPAEARRIFTELAAGLAACHGAGIVHRDLKPSNVLLAPDGSAKLSDFGIARAADLTLLTGTSTLLGTPAYLAPEGARDERSDLYALGVLGYELLTGAPPFGGVTPQEVLLAHLRTPPDLSKVPPDLRPLLARLLAKDPARRPASAAAVLAELQGEATPRPAPTAAPPASRPPRRRRALAGLGILGLAALVAGSALVLGAGATSRAGHTASASLTALVGARASGGSATGASATNNVAASRPVAAIVLPSVQISYVSTQPHSIPDAEYLPVSGICDPPNACYAAAFDFTVSVVRSSTAGGGGVVGLKIAIPEAWPGGTEAAFYYGRLSVFTQQVNTVTKTVYWVTPTRDATFVSGSYAVCLTDVRSGRDIACHEDAVDLHWRASTPFWP
jgi:serine/threonine-protein kinase